MHDLIGAYERMNQVYQWYIESAFPLRYQGLSEERKRLLSKGEILSQPPLLETIPVYPTSGLNLQEASQAFAKGLPRPSIRLAQALLPSGYSGSSGSISGKCLQASSYQWTRHCCDDRNRVWKNGMFFVTASWQSSHEESEFMARLPRTTQRNSKWWEK